MRFLLVAAMVLAHGVPGSGYDRARVLLSDHAVVCSPDTPVETARHLVETWGALICVVQSDALWAHPELLPWVSVLLPAFADTAADSLASWKERIHLDAAVTTDDPGLAQAAASAGLRVFSQSPSFVKGAVAIPSAGGYLYYQGPSPAFFNRAGYFETRLADTLKSRDRDGWIALGRALSEAFREGDMAVPSRWQTLLDATHAADSLNSLEGADNPMWVYAERWRYCLAWWLAPTCKVDTLKLLSGQETEHRIEVRVSAAMEGSSGLDVGSGGAAEAPSSPVVLLTGILSKSEGIDATWKSPWPVELAGAAPVELTGSFKSGRLGKATSAWELECRFGTFRFSRALVLPVEVEMALRAEFIPPVLYVENAHTLTHADAKGGVTSGQLELVNRSPIALALRLVWRSESPIELSGAATELTLAPGETRRTGFTLSIPGDLRYKEYGFGADVYMPEGQQMSARGQLWKETPRRTGHGSLGTVGCSKEWQGALPTLGVSVVELLPDSIAGSDLAALDAVLIRHGAQPPSQASVNAISEFVRQGGVAILEIGPDALPWLPWPVGTVRRPGPFAASFYREDLEWWQSPNGLVAGCFAAADRDTVPTLTAGASGWEPLLVDDQGKGFMYRHQHGRGWYILIHAGWSPRLEQLERRAHLGLLNLMSAASR